MPWKAASRRRTPKHRALRSRCELSKWIKLTDANGTIGSTIVYNLPWVSCPFAAIRHVAQRPGGKIPPGQGYNVRFSESNIVQLFDPVGLNFFRKSIPMPGHTGPAHSVGYKTESLVTSAIFICVAPKGGA